MEKNISINQLAVFIPAEEGKRLTIIKQQKKPNTFKVAPYSTARSSMKNFVKNGFSIESIRFGVEKLQGRQSTSDYQKRDIQNSIEALRKFLELQFPADFKNLKIEFVKTNDGFLALQNLNVIVSPDIIIKGEKNGITFYGGLKFHIAKGKIFTHSESEYAATAIYMFLKQKFKGESINPNYCLSVEVFGGRITPAPDNPILHISLLKKACIELVKLWEAA